MATFVQEGNPTRFPSPHSSVPVFADGRLSLRAGLENLSERSRTAATETLTATKPQHPFPVLGAPHFNDTSSAPMTGGVVEPELVGFRAG